MPSKPAPTLDWNDLPSGLPLFQRVAEAVAGEIRRGRFAPGQRLPSSRRMAQSLAVHRNTVLAAFEELARQGYIETRPARGTFVATSLPQGRVRAPKLPKEGVPVKLRLPPPVPSERRYALHEGTLALVGGLPDLRSLPTQALARAYRSALQSNAALLDYQSELGNPRLLRVLSSYLRDTRGVLADEGEIITTRGSQHALHLVARALVRPGSVIAVERYGYPPAWAGFRLAGAELAPVGVDGEGVLVSEVEALCDSRDVAALYVTPHHQYPTTVTMSAARRIALLRLAARRRFCIIEDDYDHEFHFEGRPVLPLASSDPARVVVHVGTLSKVMAPGLRLGYAVGRAEIIERMAAHRRYIDRQGDHVTELALAFLIEDGELPAHVRRMHRAYRERRAAFSEALRRRLGDVLAFETPGGGLAIWARILGDHVPEAWVERAERRDLVVHPASRFCFEGRSAPFFRLGFARHNATELREGVRRLEQSLREGSSGRRRG